ncbi:carboxylesterase family protein [Actinomadura alba]
MAAGSVAVVTALVATGVLSARADTGTGPAAGGAARDPAIVRTGDGPVRGTVKADHRSFQRIPYAAPPVGELRWRSPRPAASWTAPRDATRPGAGCAQLAGLPMDAPSESEDCLYLNVTTPRDIQGKRLPVMVWLHGGHFLFGQGDTYGGASLAARGDVIVVTMNYRLGALGFLAHPALDGPTPGASGNFGLEDQQAALRWVGRNAAAFGGDPGNVTLFGQSAGATSVCAHLAAPSSAGLFHRVITQSNSCTAPVQDRRTAEAQGRSLAAELNCGGTVRTAACLRARPVAKVLKAVGYPGSGYDPGPVAGGPVLPVDPARALATGRFAKVPVMNGTTHDEYRGQLWGMERAGMNCPGGTPRPKPCPLTAKQYAEQLEATFGDKAAAVREKYPLAGFGSPSEALAAAMTDHSYARPALDADRLFARQVPTYAYEFADRQAPFFAGIPRTTFPAGAYHLAELPYLFAVGYADPLSADQRGLSDQMLRYWARFAHRGDPNDAAAPRWPRFQASDRYVQSLAPGHGGIGPADFAKDHHYEFWHSLGR